MTSSAAASIPSTVEEAPGRWVTVIREDELPPGEMLGLEIGEARLALYNVDGVFFATANICTHAFALLSDGWLEDGVIECPLHAGRFDVRSGEPLSEPAECALRTYPTRVANGMVDVLLGVEAG
jgi:nitrite reductase/ring-hydroxylating ferredoxin subunit